VLEVLAAHGVPSCSWQRLERETAADATRAEALAALAEARTARTAAILLDQAQGAWARALDAVAAALERDDAGTAAGLLDELHRRAPLGGHLTAPWRVVVAGAPNVGKSSLVNALAGYERCVVSAVPGTTRDVVTALLAVEGWPVELADTAGLGEHAGGLELQGQERARAELAGADLCLWVLDAAAPVWPVSRPEGVRFVVNKTDLPAVWDPGKAADAVHVSARTGAGLADLCRALAWWLVPEPPPAGAAVPFTRRLAGRLAEALRHCRGGRTREAAEVLRTLWSCGTEAETGSEGEGGFGLPAWR
jgi:tRNA modification GTPase